MWIGLAFIGGFVLGLIVMMIVKSRQTADSRQVAEELLRDSETRRQQELDRVIEHVKLSFGSLSSEALKNANDEFLKLRKSLVDADREAHSKELDSKKGLIDARMGVLNTELEKLQQLVVGLEKDRATKFGELDSSIKSHQSQVTLLMQTTNSLREALASTKARGQWGERMAEDVLRLAGFLENVNYFKQRTVDGGTSRPDFTFPLPRGFMLNMDVKFPLDNYLKYLDANSETEESRFRDDFLRDVRQHVKAVCNRDYINPAENTVDYMLLFIPNEQIYGFINQTDRQLLDDAMKTKVIVCSPLTLYAILAVIRQAADNFAFEQSSQQILQALSSVEKQWRAFTEKFDLLSRKIEETQKVFTDLSTTRTRQLDRAFDRIQDLRSNKAIELSPDEVDTQQ